MNTKKQAIGGQNQGFWHKPESTRHSNFSIRNIAISIFETKFPNWERL
jgi:hypothetical protein